jgi:hypothetical protein
VTKAANFNAWEAARFLLDRYEDFSKHFSKQRQRSLRQLIEQLRHVHGTNMSRHIDRFERICGQMAHNNPDKPPTDEREIDWFLDSVTEKIYDSVHATCTDKLLDGDLTFAKAIKLYTHRCFQRYPSWMNWSTLPKLSATTATPTMEKGRDQVMDEFLTPILMVGGEQEPPTILRAPVPLSKKREKQIQQPTRQRQISQPPNHRRPHTDQWHAKQTQRNLWILRRHSHCPQLLETTK